jgi:hypothetical protein
MFSCRARDTNEIPALADVTSEAGANSDLIPEANSLENQDGKISTDEEIERLKTQLKEIEDQLTSNAQLNADEIAKLQKSKAELEEKLKTMTSSPSTASTGTPTTPAVNPSCGAGYYGTVFACGTKQCAKADPQYQKVCQLDMTSKPLDSSGYPLCGTTYYGDVFECKTKMCAKSDSQFVNICEIGPGSAAAN